MRIDFAAPVRSFTTVWAIRSETVGIPRVLRPPDFFGIATALDRGWKVAPRRHAIPDPIQVVPSALQTPEGTARPLQRLLHSPLTRLYASHTSRFGISLRLCRCHALLPSRVGDASAGQPGSLAPDPLQTLRPLLRASRRCAALRYSGPRKGLFLAVSLTSPRRFLQFRTKARTTLAAISCRTPPHPVSRFRWAYPEQHHLPGFDVV